MRVETVARTETYERSTQFFENAFAQLSALQTHWKTHLDLDFFFSRLNPILAALLRSPLHFVVSPGLVLITVTGRRTGRRYSIPVGYQLEGNTVVILVSKAHRKQWWRNYREARPIELRLRGRERTGIAEVVPPATNEFGECIERTLLRMPALSRQFEVDFDAKNGLQPAQLDALARSCAVVRVTLREENARA